MRQAVATLSQQVAARMAVQENHLESLSKRLNMNFAVEAQKSCQFDPWTVRSEHSPEALRNPHFREAAIKHHFPDGSYCCQLTKRTTNLVAAHIFPSGGNSLCRDFAQLTIEEVQSPRNSLILIDALEKAFDARRFCFVAGSEQDVYRVVKLLPKFRRGSAKDPYLEALDLIPEGLEVKLSGVSKTALSYHCFMAYKLAVDNKWISKRDKPRFFGTPPKGGGSALSLLYEIASRKVNSQSSIRLIFCQFKASSESSPALSDKVNSKSSIRFIFCQFKDSESSPGSPAAVDHSC